MNGDERRMRRIRVVASGVQFASAVTPLLVAGGPNAVFGIAPNEAIIGAIITPATALDVVFSIDWTKGAQCPDTSLMTGVGASFTLPVDGLGRAYGTQMWVARSASAVNALVTVTLFISEHP